MFKLCTKNTSRGNYPYPYGYEQYQAAFNAAAYRAMQQQQQPPAQFATSSTSQTPGNQQKTSSSNGVSISQPAQRYDYSNVNKTSNTPATQNFYSNYPNQPNVFDPTASANVFPSMIVPPPSLATNKPMISKNVPLQNSKFKTIQKKPNQFKQRRAPSAQQLFYCEICKVSCAGPQTYKEHLDGQKHKKREQTHKVADLQMASNTETPSDSNVASTTTNNLNSATMAPMNNMSNKNTNFKTNAKTESNRNSTVVRCELCDISCTGRDAYAAHIRGIKHQKTLKLHQKLGKPIPPDFLNLPAQSNSNVLSTKFVTTSAPFSNISQTSNVSGPPPVTVAPPPPPPPPPTPPIQQKLSLLHDSPHSPPSLNIHKPIVPIPTNVSPQQSYTKTVNADMIGQTSEQIQTDTNEDYANIQDLDSMSANLEPIGKEYIEARVEGKILSFYCKLCDCSFNDPNAKDMHTKGRRHRLAYKVNFFFFSI
jgi:zinc finger RNA-binding protein